MGLVLTDEERRAVASLKRLSSRWPDSLWLYSGNGTLHVMKKRDGNRVYTGSPEGIDPDYAVANVAIENDGGDW